MAAAVTNERTRKVLPLLLVPRRAGSYSPCAFRGNPDCKPPPRWVRELRWVGRRSRPPRGYVEPGMRIGLLTGGGDCPGLNAVIRAVVRRGIDGHGHSVVGF